MDTNGSWSIGKDATLLLKNRRLERGRNQQK